MALERSETAHTLLSRQWTTSEMFEGLSQILLDGKDKLPDDLAQLEASCSSWAPLAGILVQWHILISIDLFIF